MYDELDMALEDAFDEGYYQALIDMGIDPEDIAEEDVDIFDDDYFDGAMEGNPDNRKAKRKYFKEQGYKIHRENLGKITGKDIDDDTALWLARSASQQGSSMNKNVDRRKAYSRPQPPLEIGQVHRRDYLLANAASSGWQPGNRNKSMHRNGN